MTVELTPFWNPLREHDEQHRLWNTDKRYAAVVAGRGSGKTELARRRIVMHLALKKPWPNPIYAYCLPTFAQAKRVAWRPLLDLIPPNWIKNGMKGINVTDLSVDTIFGSTLYVMGMDKPQRIEGLQLDGVVLDESSDQRLGVMKSIAPACTHRNPWIWRIGVPKRDGIGRIEFREFFEKGLIGDPNIDSFHWKSSTVLTQEQLEQHRSALTEQDFDEQFNAEWIDAGGSIYHAYSPENISEEAIYDPSLPILVGADFNVDPMCWVLGHQIEEEIRIFDEVFLRNTNTEATLNHVFNQYGHHTAGWKFYCDASSRQRRTNQTTVRTDYIIIKNDERFGDKQVYYPNKNPALRDRFATANAALCNAKGVRRTKINPRCRHLINDFKIMAYQEGTTTPEDYTGTDIGHTADGFGYLIWRVMPMKLFTTAVPTVLTTR